MQSVIIVIHLMIVVAMIGVVLLQKSEGGGLGVGSTGGFMSSRGTANVLTRATAVLAGTFFATSLILSILAGFHRNPTTIKGRVTGPSVLVDRYADGEWQSENTAEESKPTDCRMKKITRHARGTWRPGRGWRSSNRATPAKG